MMGRNYDFKRDTSAMLVYCTPKDGYKSVALAALDNISGQPAGCEHGEKARLPDRTVHLSDGMNEEGVSIAVLTLDSEPVNQDTGKQKFYDPCHPPGAGPRRHDPGGGGPAGQLRYVCNVGRDYHFFVTDAAGDARVIEY